MGQFVAWMNYIQITAAHLSRELFIRLQAHQDPALCKRSQLGLNCGILKHKPGCQGLPKLIGVLPSCALCFHLLLATPCGRSGFWEANAFEDMIKSEKGRSFLNGKFLPRICMLTCPSPSPQANLNIYL